MNVKKQFETRSKKYQNIIVTWIGDFNPKMIRIAENLCSTKYMTLYTYRKLFDENADTWDDWELGELSKLWISEINKIGMTDNNVPNNSKSIPYPWNKSAPSGKGTSSIPNKNKIEIDVINPAPHRILENTTLLNISKCTLKATHKSNDTNNVMLPAINSKVFTYQEKNKNPIRRIPQLI